MWSAKQAKKEVNTYPIEDRYMEGPSLVILREELQQFFGKKVLKVTGNTKQPKDSLKGLILTKIDTWAKVLFLEFSPPSSGTNKSVAPVITKTHFLMFGSYRINDPKKDREPRLELKFKKGILSFYSCSIQFDARDYFDAVDRKVDLMSPAWCLTHVLRLLVHKRSTWLCDLLLDQGIFAGSGNIVKNEVLFNIRRHPLTKLSQVSEKDWPALVRAVRDYCFHFYEWKKKYELRKHWQVYRKNICPICRSKLVKVTLGKLSRKTFYCQHCQSSSLARRKLRVFQVLPITAKAAVEKRFEH
jgi:endonuclease-8